MNRQPTANDLGVTEFGTREGITCKKCGKRGLFFGKTARGWRLFQMSDERIHICASQKTGGGR